MTKTNFTVNVTENAAPTAGTYADQTVTPGANVTVTPNAAPMDNGLIQSVTAAVLPNTFTGSLNADPTTGVVTILNAAPAGTYTITVTVKDNCGEMVQKMFRLSVNSTPTITTAAYSPITRKQGVSASNARIATVNDAESGADNVTVTAMTVPMGISLTNLVNTSGTITADISAECGVLTSDYTVVLKVSDGSLETTADLTVKVSENSQPTVGNYDNQTVLPGGSVTVTPDAAPADNGSIQSIIASASPNPFTGTFTSNLNTGAITINNAAPAGTYLITVTVTDNCGATVQQTFTLAVNTPPTINALAASAQQGSFKSSVPIATVSDPESGANGVTVTLFSDGSSDNVRLSGKPTNRVNYHRQRRWLV